MIPWVVSASEIEFARHLQTREAGNFLNELFISLGSKSMMNIAYLDQRILGAFEP